MTQRKRFLISLTATVFFLFLVMVFVTAAVHRAGTIEVYVNEAGPCGDRISLRIPGALAQTALAFVPQSAFGCDLDEEELAWFEVVAAAASYLDRMPDATLVEVDGGHGEHVVIRKEGANIIVDVRDGGDNVHVSVPLPTVKAAARKFKPRNDFL
jgi:hypothetical protein